MRAEEACYTILPEEMDLVRDVWQAVLINRTRGYIKGHRVQ
ncbi:MAG TPA: hypothetical protein VGN26_14185 [Armatimonadota bacterium]|jgi:predicted AAA+ superfamily ATPase